MMMTLIMVFTMLPITSSEVRAEDSDTIQFETTYTKTVSKQSQYFKPSDPYKDGYYYDSFEFSTTTVGTFDVKLVTKESGLFSNVGIYKDGETYTGHIIGSPNYDSTKGEYTYNIIFGGYTQYSAGKYHLEIRFAESNITDTAKEYSFSITNHPKVDALKTIQIAKSNYTYTGKSIKPNVTIIKEDGTTAKSSDYTVSYSNNKAIGTAKITATGRNNCAGKITKTFVINPKSTTQYAPVRAKKAFTVKWKKSTAANCIGYQIKYSTSSKMSKYTIIKVKGNKNTSKKISKLKANKKYYVCVRTYKTVNGKNYYSSWSTKKAVITK